MGCWNSLSVSLSVARISKNLLMDLNKILWNNRSSATRTNPLDSGIDLDLDSIVHVQQHIKLRLLYSN